MQHVVRHPLPVNRRIWKACFLAVAASFSMFAAARPACAAADAGRYLHKQGSKTLKDAVQGELGAAKKAGQGVVLMFTSDWCSPCKAIKEFVKGSAVVRKALAKGRLLYIDVDEWRGPAQTLIAGVDASKLPTLVRLDADWKVLQTCFGSELGLLHEDAIAHNLGRLLEGKPIEKPFYDGKPDLEREFIGKQSEAQTAKTKGVPTLEVKAKGGASDRTVRLILRNHDGPRRWYLVPARLDGPLSEHPSVRQWWRVRWTEHVRADYLRLVGSPEFYAIPVAGYGSVEIESLPMAGASKDGKFVVFELDYLKFDGQDQQFQTKLPYSLKIANFGQQAVAGQGEHPKVELRVRARHTAVVK